jgi:pimeloyl-ACP methyl ester carboxylesterase
MSLRAWPYDIGILADVNAETRLKWVKERRAMPFAQINGFRMYYEVAGQGTPCLFVHGGLGGGNGSATFQQYQMPRLAPYAEVVAFDRRAAGRSETPASAYAFSAFIDDIVALLDHLGHECVVLMATSAGGPQILQCALSHPDRVMALVLGSTATQTVRVPPELASLITFLGTDGLGRLQEMFGQGATDQAASPFANFGGILQTYLAYHLHGDPIAEQLGEITVPALILHGTADAEVAFAEGERLLAGLPNASIVPFEGGGHRIMASDPDAYAQAVLTFLRALMV